MVYSNEVIRGDSVKGLFTKVWAGIRNEAGNSAAPGPYVPGPEGAGR